MLRFSIVIPNYNKGPYIDECLQSILNQSINKDKYEIIVIDDGSNDNSLDILAKYPTIKLLHTNRMLAGGARNAGIKVAQGEYLVFLDSDDFLCTNNVLEKLDEHIKGEDLIFLNYYKQSPKGTTLVEEQPNSSAMQPNTTGSFGCPTKCFKKSIVTLFDEKCYYEDIYFTLYAICNSKTYSFFTPPFFTYRYVQGSITKSKEISSKKMIDLLIQISKLYYLCDMFPAHKDSLIERIKNDRLNDRLKVLNEYFETGNNTFYDVFK